MIDSDGRAGGTGVPRRDASALTAEAAGIHTVVVEHADIRPAYTPARADSTTEQEGTRLGYAFAACVLVSGAALVLMSVADALARSGRSGGDKLFWIGVLSPIIIAAYCLTLPQLRRSERLAILVTIG